MLTFKQFLIEGGHATAKFKTQRAGAEDIKAALQFVSKVIGVPVDTLQSNLLGSTELTLVGKKKDSGDIDIALSLDEHDPSEIHEKMMAATKGQGSYQSGSKIGSYAVPSGKKKVQVDLMFVKNKDWAKFMFHSSAESQYPGAVRNIILLTALAHTQTPGKDFVIRDENGRAIARASKSIYLGSGMRRLFKIAKINKKTGKRNKGLETVTPEELEAHLKEIGKKIKFSSDVEHTDDPDEVASFIFGKGVKAKDIMTAEDVIKHIKKLKNANEILAASRSELKRLKLPIPADLT